MLIIIRAPQQSLLNSVWYTLVPEPIRSPFAFCLSASLGRAQAERCQNLAIVQIGHLEIVRTSTSVLHAVAYRATSQVSTSRESPLCAFTKIRTRTSSPEEASGRNADATRWKR